MKENSIEEYIKLVEELITAAKEYNQFEGNKYYKAIDHILKDYKRVLKENEELKQDRNNNYRMIALAQNEILGYMQGYEDGKKLKRSAVACVVENQQYYIIKKEIEHYKEYIEKLQKENEELKEKNDKNIAYAEYLEKILNEYKKESVSKQKVKDKIRKNEEIIDISNDGDLIHELLQKNKVYEELLKEDE